MAVKRSLADLAAAFSSKNTGSDNATWKLFFNFWKAPVDSVSTVRFLPDADDKNPFGFLVENLTHDLTINGKRETVACLKMYGEACPVCELSARFDDKKSSEFNEDIGRLFYRKKSYTGQVLVLETPVEHDASQLVKLINFGPQVFKQIQAGLQSGDLEENPTELKGGYNFRFRKTVTGSGQNSYTTSSFAPKQSDVSDELIEQMSLYDLKEYRTPKTERADLEAMLVAAQTGGTYEGPSGTAPGTATTADDSEPAATPVSPPNTPAPSPAPAPTPAPAPAPSSASNDVLAKLRARVAAQKTAQADQA
jgi:hypothetical protein